MALDFDSLRMAMVAEQIERRGIHDQGLLAVLRSIPRHWFVPPDVQSLAYDDCPLPIGQGQTISQPYIVALMTALLHLQGSETVLEIGTGSGYQAAILAHLCQTVHTVERHPALAAEAEKILASLNLPNLSVHTGDGSLGWSAGAPYHGILVTAAAPKPPPPLLDQLADGGCLVIPVGGRSVQELVVWQREGNRFIEERNLAVAFVPLRGKHGWNEEAWPENSGRFW